MKNLDFCKTVTEVKAQARKIGMDFLKENLIEVFGEENVSQIGDSEYAVAVGTKSDTDGFEHEVCITFKPTTKEFMDRTTAKKTFEEFNRLDEAEAYELSKKEKEQKKAESKANSSKKTSKKEEQEKRKQELEEVHAKVQAKAEQEKEELRQKKAEQEQAEQTE